MQATCLLLLLPRVLEGRLFIALSSSIGFSLFVFDANSGHSTQGEDTEEGRVSRSAPCYSQRKT